MQENYQIHMIFFMMCMFVFSVWFSRQHGLWMEFISAAASKMSQSELPVVLSKLLLGGSPTSDSLKKKICDKLQSHATGRLCIWFLKHKKYFKMYSSLPVTSVVLFYLAYLFL